MSLNFAESEALATATGVVLLVLALLALALLYRPKLTAQTMQFVAPVRRTGRSTWRAVPVPASAINGAGRRSGAVAGEMPRRQRRPAGWGALVAWLGASKRRTASGLAAVALFVAAVIELIPLTGALPRGALRPVFPAGLA